MRIRGKNSQFNTKKGSIGQSFKEQNQLKEKRKIIKQANSRLKTLE